MIGSRNQCRRWKFGSVIDLSDCTDFAGMEFRNFRCAIDQLRRQRSISAKCLLFLGSSNDSNSDFDLDFHG